MKNTYIFILGKTPQLSIAELKSILDQETEFLLVNQKVAIITVNQPLDLAELQNQLGGIIKIGTVFEKVAELAVVNWVDYWQPSSPKFQFGFSGYFLSHSERIELKRKGLQLKKQWVAEGSSCRLVVSQEADLSSVIVIKEKLLSPGADFLVVKDEVSGGYWLGQTQACQKFEEYAEAEFGRPQADSRRGMIPLKLAKMMINLAGQPQGKLLDPFCGLGTVLTAAASLGWKQLAASDLDGLAVKQAKVNWQWLLKKDPSLGSTAEFAVGSVTELSRVWPKQLFGAMVTEPDLGPALKHLPKPEQLREIQKKLMVLYQNFLMAAASVLSTQGTLVMIWPIWQGANEWLTLPIEKIINQKIWTILDLGQTEYQLQPKIFSSRRSLWYARPDQVVGREIWVLRKN